MILLVYVGLRKITKVSLLLLGKFKFCCADENCFRVSIENRCQLRFYAVGGDGKEPRSHQSKIFILGNFLIKRASSRVFYAAGYCHVARRFAISAAPVPANATYLIHPNALLAKDTALQMAQAGYPVTLLDSLTTLQSVLVPGAPAVVILDLGRTMVTPQMSSELQQLRLQSHITLLVISARGNFESRLRAARVGAEAYFVRPVDVVAVGEKIDQSLRSHEQAPFRVLLVGDESQREQQLRDAGMDVATLHKPAELFNRLVEFHAELILIDLAQPECDGLDLTRLIRQDSLYLDIPVICLDSAAVQYDETHIMVAGADDFLSASISPERLCLLLSSRAGRYRALRGLIMRDSLTGLYNHAAIKEYLAREMALIERHAAPLSIAMIDLDFFKKVNDTYGHPVGDQVIRGLSRLLQQRLRRGDLIGRYGGEEFVVLMPATTADAAVAVLQAIGAAFAELVHVADGVGFCSTFSAGVAEARGHADADSLVQAADAALYQAKHAGRNCVIAAEMP